MKSRYDPSLKAHLTLDDNEKVRQIRHSKEYFLSEHNIPRLAADDYLNKMAEPLRIPKEELKNLNKKVSFFDPREQGIEYHLSEEKHLFDSITVGYYQTYHNVPVWRRGISVKIKQNPNRVVGSTNNSENDIHGKLPETETIDPYKKVFRQAAARKAAIDAGLSEEEREDETASFVRKLINVKAPPTTTKIKRAKVSRVHDETRMLSGKFFIYKYDPKRRYAGRPSPLHEIKTKKISEEEQEIRIPKLPAVSDKIKSEESYLVAEVIFTSNAPGFNGLVWLILVEVETGSILYIECMTCGVNGKVFRLDPIVKTADLSITSDDDNMALNPHRYDKPLTDLDGPDAAGRQHLRGTFVNLETLTDPHADPDDVPPSNTSGTNFDYDARTNSFGAVNAYYHQTELFKTIEDLGFPILGPASYFDGTTFPISVDHRSLGDVINAHWSPNGTGGTGHMCYALCDQTNTAEPLLRAVDPWVHWHEMGGHGTLGDHVGSGNLGFSHSAGDGLAAIQMDPESALRDRALPERFRYAPFRPFTTERRFDRDVSTWAWGGGANDDGGYGSEQILATCHFRIYRSIGGDHDNLGRRQFASRMVTYLILRTISNLTPMTNPSNWDPVAMTNVPGRGAQLWCEEMQDTDLENWTSEGLSGGAYNKVIRWAFEKQGSYQPAGAPTPVTTVGSPPEVDVYIDDGRSGEYQFQAIHWENMSIWNRNAPDGIPGHQNAIEGLTNYMYGKVKNRGTSAATKVTVRSYHSLPGAGLIWPDDFTEMSPVGGLPIPSIGANDTQEVTVGPFEWVPNVNAYGHDCVLMIASANDDPSNIDNFTGAETIAEWRLVLNDNNIGQRNVSIVPGGGGSEALIAALDGAVFFASNSFNRPAKMELRADMPRVLASKGWSLKFADLDDNKFRLKVGEKQNVRLNLSKGNEFTADEIKNAEDRSIRVYLYGNNMPLGGMTYQIDPDLKEPSGGKRLSEIEHTGAAQKLLDSLKISAEKKVKNVRVKNISVDIELDSNAD